MDTAFASALNAGCTAVVCYLLFHLLTRSLPQLVKFFMESSEKVAELHRAALKDAQGLFLTLIESDRRELGRDTKAALDLLHEIEIETRAICEKLRLEAVVEQKRRENGGSGAVR